MKKLKNLIFILWLIMLPFPVKAQQQPIPLNDWSSLPVMHDGRIKPIDSFARIIRKTLSGHESASGMDAVEWLAFTIFNPAEAVEQPALRARLDHGAAKLITFQEAAKIIQEKNKIIGTLLNQPESEWTPEQKNLMELHENFLIYSQLLRSLIGILPMQSGMGGFYIDEQKNLDELNKKVKKIVKNKGEDIEKYNKEEKEIVIRSFQLNMVRGGGENNILLRVIPQSNEFISPWTILNDPKSSPETLKNLELWRDLANAYREGDKEKWDRVTAELQKLHPDRKLKIENIFNRLNLINLALIFYSAGLVSYFFSRQGIKTSFFFQLAGITAHAIHIGLRIYILERPPVGTLYESVIFVALICVAGFFFIAARQKTSNHIFLGHLSGILLLITAKAFAPVDTMSTLVAVLNTNFWLATHVVCITIGYSFCLLTSFLAHYELARSYLKKSPLAISSNLKILAILSLFFVSVGTALGGLWADQSWGRFWGWDPKENGALLIALWLIWLLHGKISRHINDTAYMAGLAYLSVVVVLAWFGVNLLSVGLHSYGFISGVAWGIGLFCAVETALIASLWHAQKYIKQSA